MLFCVRVRNFRRFSFWANSTTEKSHLVLNSVAFGFADYIPEQNIAGPWGFFYVAQDESGAWGELHYEEVLLTEDKYEDPRTAPTDGFDNKKTWAVKSAASVAFPAPIRFSKASFMQVTESFGGF